MVVAMLPILFPRKARLHSSAAAAAVLLTLGGSPAALATPLADPHHPHYAFHPLTGDAYLLRDLPGTEPPDQEQNTTGDSSGAHAEAPTQELLRLHHPALLAHPDPRPGDLGEDDYDLVAHTPVADPADFLVVAPDSTLYTVHTTEDEHTLLASYREPDTTEEPPADQEDGSDTAPAVTVDIHLLPDNLDVVAVRSDERGAFLITGDGTVLLLNRTDSADGAPEITLTLHTGPAPDREPWQPPEETANTPVPSPEPPAPVAEPATAVHDSTEPAATPEPEDPAPLHLEAPAADHADLPPGVLVMTLPEGPVHLSAPRMSADSFHQTATGTLAPATVVDLRGTNAGWSLVGQVSDLEGSAGGSIDAHLLGWAPTATVLDSPDSSTVRPGAAVRPGDGLAVPRTLCAGAAGASTGVFACQARLELGIPADTPPGEYAGTLTLTLS